MKKPIYMDYQATTPVDPEVIKVINDEMMGNFGNPHSRSHSFGWKAENVVDESRATIASAINAERDEIIFTSGATEANNIAIRGAAEYLKDRKNHIITVETEHKCVINTARFLATQGSEVTFLKPMQNGIIDLNALKDAITPKTALVSIMAVNNEIGVIQPLEEIGKITRENGILFHTDAAQAFGKIPLDVQKMNIDMLSISGHKIYGPKGVGALYIRKKPRVRLIPLIQGGGQERGFRSGTLPTPLIAGFAKATEICMKTMASEEARLRSLFEYACDELLPIEAVYLNGDRKQRFPGNMNFSFSCIEGESMIMAIADVSVSSGSACTSSSLEPSYVIRALGISDDLAHTSIRFGIGRFTTREEVEFMVKLVKEKVQRLRDISPLWDMYKAGIDTSQIKWGSH